MQIGAENRSKLIAAAVLGVLAVLLVGRWLFNFGGRSSPESAAASAAAPIAVETPSETRARPATTRRGGKRVRGTVPQSLDPTLRFDWLRQSEDTKYEGSGRNIFQAQVELPKPIVNPALDKRKKALPPPPPQGPPPPPPIDLKFYGFASKPGEPKRIFLSQGEDVFIASEGEIVDRRYKILRISPVSVEVEDVLNNNRQEIPLTQG